MEPKKRKDTKNSTLLYIGLIFLVIAAVGFGFSIVRFANQNKFQNNQRIATAANRVSENQILQIDEQAEVAETEAAPALPTATPTDTPTPTVKPTANPEPTVEPTPEAQDDKAVKPESLHSEFACMIKSSDGEIVFDKNAKEKMYPASMSKIMTAIIAIENIPDLEAMVTVTPEDIDPSYEREASMAGFAPYEEVKIIDLLYGALLPSGAEACEALVRQVSDSMDDFAELMNKKAEEIGMTNSHFTSASGLHDDNHYTTAYDMALLMKYCMQNSVFRTIVSTASYTCTQSEQHPDGLYFESTVYAGMPKTSFDNGAVFEGGKTGTTDEAGRCLVSGAVFYGEEYFLVTGHAVDIESGNFDDAVTLYSSLTKE